MEACPTADVPHVHVISDSLGDTAFEVVRAAAGQFDEGIIAIDRLPKVRSAEQVQAYLVPRIEAGQHMAAFHTIVEPVLHAEVVNLLSALRIPSVDLMAPAIDTISILAQAIPNGVPGSIHRTDDQYFKRIACMEYFVEHDDGRNADDIAEADIVLLGISRTSKTPLSMYLAYRGYKVANIPLALGVEPPASLFELDPIHLFGLLSTTDVIAGIRDRRLGDDFARAVAGSYADPSEITREMDEARALMRRLGCMIVRTDGKAIEESASEIERHLETVKAARASRSANTSRD
ncbi:protein of unknown function DUF299 [Coriobacterium glomerans PW2]|uniref:Uncharacterized protein n=1 Tax=Coriobacterium glomerans (strain ATCC 49209 / DSM 20642 / JCM 10262 / PW2) TaxID=700015 RepID=F2N9F9_CORGP|nr:pyruvate, phosphate dikinase/phosphoenolpyruvate synthase regulator [Coriobacterium glomerans]AEB06988.1 protein of unknown function DUF299 [Coriobacterium glomerans PW2]